MTTALLDRPLDPPVDDATRRQFLAGAAALLVAAGCGGDDDRQPAAGQAPTTAGPSSYRITNKFGSFDVPADPQRVIVLEGRRDLEVALALGWSPVAVGPNTFYVGDKLPAFLNWQPANVTKLGQGGELNIEVVAGLRPDLIIGRESNVEGAIDKLRPLGAPFITVAGGSEPWRPELEAIASELGRLPKVAGSIADYDKALADLRTRHAARLAGATLAIAQFGGKEFYSSPPGGFYLQVNVLAELGGRHLPWLNGLPLNRPGGSSTSSIEQIEQLAPADAFLVVVNDADQRRELDELELWKRLPAVAAGRVVYTDFRTNYGSVFAARECLRLLDQAYGLIR